MSRILHAKVVLTGWTNIYWLVWFFGASVSAIIYMTLDYLWPMQHKGLVDDEDYFGTFTELQHVQGIGYSSTNASIEQHQDSVKDEKIVNASAMAV